MASVRTSCAVNTASSIITAILDLIGSTSSNSSIAKLLNDLKLDELPRDSANVLLNSFLERATICQNKNAVYLIMEVFDVYRVNADPLPSITGLFLNPRIKKVTLDFVVKDCFGHIKAPLDYFRDIANVVNQPIAEQAANNCGSYFLGSTLSWMDVWRDINPDEYHPLYDFLREKVNSQPKRILEPPPYVKECAKSELIDVESLPSVGQACGKIMSVMSQKLQEDEHSNECTAADALAQSDEDFVRIVIADYCMSTVNGKRIKLGLERIDQEHDDALFRELGPVNTNHNQTPHHICSQYGGCRMFLCSEFADVDEEYDGTNVDDDPVDWFTGTCDKCDAVIAKRRYAVRIPLEDGGWMGTYCSIDCLKQDVAEDDFVTGFKIGMMREQLKSIGIRK
jgi:hypothetical protein